VKISVQALRELCDLQATVLNDSEPVLVEVWKGVAVAAAGDAAAAAGDAAAAAGDAAASACELKVECIEHPHWDHLGREFNTTTSLKRLLTDEDFSHDVQLQAQVKACSCDLKPPAS